MALPSFLCIGAQKAGTSWLFEQLRTHPSIWMPPVKELHYFDYIFTDDTRKWGHWHLNKNVASAVKWHMDHTPSPNLHFVRYLSELATRDVFSEPWYRRAFDWPAGKGKVLGDITPEYSTIGAIGISYVKSLMPDIKLIYIIRDPFTRALSQLKMNISRHPIAPGDDAAWDAAAEAPEIKQRGAYSKYVPEWLSAFPEQQIMFVPYKRLRKEPAILLREVEDFLGLAAHNFEKVHANVHVTKDIEVPDRVKDRLRQAVQDDADFIRGHFGSAFADNM